MNVAAAAISVAAALQQQNAMKTKQTKLKSDTKRIDTHDLAFRERLSKMHINEN